jgi:hypothetical protein
VPAPTSLNNAVDKQINTLQDRGYLPYFEAAAQRHNVSLSILLGIASHESRMGLALDANFTGDGGHGRGLMQIDDRWHADFLATHANDDHEAIIDYAANLLRSNLDTFDQDYTKALAAYNAGAGNVRKAIRNGLPADAYTTPYKAGRGPYSGDIIERAGAFAAKLNLAPPPAYADAGSTPTQRYQEQREVREYAPISSEVIPLTNSDSILAILGVISPTDEATPLASLPTPKEGEIDIGDLRFGSDIETAIKPSHLNQPTAVVQQNVGSVGLVDTLRTDMSAVIGDNRTLPEITVTVALNATTRDDVNLVLRPLIAMQRRIRRALYGIGGAQQALGQQGNGMRQGWHGGRHDFRGPRDVLAELLDFGVRQVIHGPSSFDGHASVISADLTEPSLPLYWIRRFVSDVARKVRSPLFAGAPLDGGAHVSFPLR